MVKKNIKILIGIALYLQMKVRSDEVKRRDSLKGRKNIANIRRYGEKVNVWEGIWKRGKISLKIFTIIPDSDYYVKF